MEAGAAGLPLLVGLVWLGVANLIPLGPPPTRHWAVPYALIAAGVPVLGWITYAAGPVIGLGALVLGVAALRWPLAGLWRRRQQKRGKPGA